MNQRWRYGRTLYRPPDEVIKTSEYDVALMVGDTEAKRFVTTHHYSHSYPAARFRFGLYHKGILLGVAVFSVPCNDLALTTVFPIPPTLSVDLGRFVLLDCVPGNGESWFLARCFAALRTQGLAGSISYSDPLPRRSIDGTVVFRGHIGTIYQACNGVYLGRTNPRTIHALPDGSVLSARTIQKIRTQERGWKYGAEILQRFGASPLTGNPASWLAHWLPKVTRTLRHPGNHKYAWALDRSLRKTMPSSLPFPKLATLFLSQSSRPDAGQY